jgi:NADH-quinone oxidoreductase subunit M
VLLGTFLEYRWWVVPAAFGIVLAAIYMLWAYQRVFQGEPSVEANRLLPDLHLREVVMLAPIVALIAAIGVYPKPFLDRIEPSARQAALRLAECTVDPRTIEELVRRHGPIPENVCDLGGVLRRMGPGDLAGGP